MQLGCSVSEVGSVGVVGSDDKVEMVGREEVALQVICSHGNCLASGATFFLQGASMTKWSVHSHRVYKHS